MFNRDFVQAFLRNKGAVVGLVIVATILLLATFADVVFPGDPWDMAGAPFTHPLDDGLLFGSDMLGRDIASGIAHGARVSLLIGLTSTVVAVAVGVLLGVFFVTSVLVILFNIITDVLYVLIDPRVEIA